jgi:predicted nucleic acid-binding protein
MIVLDTNVLGETLRPQPEARVLDWPYEAAGLKVIDPWQWNA